MTASPWVWLKVGESEVLAGQNVISTDVSTLSQMHKNSLASNLQSYYAILCSVIVLSLSVLLWKLSLPKLGDK